MGGNRPVFVNINVHKKRTAKDLCLVILHTLLALLNEIFYLSFKINSMKTFDSLLEGWMLDEENGEKKEDFPWKVSEEDVILLKEKVKHNKTLEILYLFL